MSFVKTLVFHTNSTDNIDLLVFTTPTNFTTLPHDVAPVAWKVVKFGNQNSQATEVYSISAEVAVSQVDSKNEVVASNGIAIGEGQTAEIVPEGDSVIIKGPTGDVKKGSPTSVKNSTTKYQTVAVLIGEEKKKKPALVFEKVRQGGIAAYVFCPKIYLLATSSYQESQVVRGELIDSEFSMIALDDACVAKSDEVHILLDVDNQQGGLTTLKFGPDAESMTTAAAIVKKGSIFEP